MVQSSGISSSIRTRNNSQSVYKVTFPFAYEYLGQREFFDRAKVNLVEIFSLLIKRLLWRIMECLLMDQ